MVLADQKQSAILVDSATNKGKLSYTLKTMAAAGTAASFAELLTIPIDTSKVRLQVRASLYNLSLISYPYTVTLDYVLKNVFFQV